MKKRIIIISTSVLVLALIVSMGFYAQSRTEEKKNVATEQSGNQLPDKCKACPSKDKCAAEKVEGTAKCGDAAKCEGMKKEACGDAAKCDATKKAACAEAKKCDGMKKEATDCTASEACKKECVKKAK